MKDSYPLLENAPAHDSPEFIEYLRANNVIVLEDDCWIIIENCKHHRPDRKWYTAFAKGFYWWKDLDILCRKLYLIHAEDWEWRRNARQDQTIKKRFHLHLIEPEKK